jgi:hypothetical protein
MRQAASQVPIAWFTAVLGFFAILLIPARLELTIGVEAATV